MLCPNCACNVNKGDFSNTSMAFFSNEVRVTPVPFKRTMVLLICAVY